LKKNQNSEIDRLLRKKLHLAEPREEELSISASTENIEVP